MLLVVGRSLAMSSDSSTTVKVMTEDGQGLRAPHAGQAQADRSSA